MQNKQGEKCFVGRGSSPSLFHRKSARPTVVTRGGQGQENREGSQAFGHLHSREVLHVAGALTKLMARSREVDVRTVVGLRPTPGAARPAGEEDSEKKQDQMACAL